MLKNAKNYCLNTGFHGLKFIALPNRRPFERAIWIILVLSCTVIAFIVLYYAWDDTRDRQIQLVISSVINKIWNYHFPAVTICNFNQISKRKAKQFSSNIESLVNYSAKDIEPKLKNLIYLFGTEDFPKSDRSLLKVQDLLDYNNVEGHRLITNLSINCREIFEICNWKGTERSCESLFQFIATEMGFCCSFNFFGLKDRTFDSPVYSRGQPKAPRRVSGIGQQSGLEVLLKTKVNDYLASDVSSYGFKIIIHNPYEFPDPGLPFIQIGLNESVFITVNPTIKECKDEPQDMKPTIRQCYRKNEKELDIFATTFHNCMIDCKRRMIHALCTCIPFYFYKPKGIFKDARMCNLRDSSCLQKYKHILMSSEPGINHTFNIFEGEFQFKECDCLLDCDNTEYKIESSSAVLTRDYSVNGFQLFGNVKLANHSVFAVYFENLVGRKTTYVTGTSWYTMFGMFGAILSLLTGFNLGCILEFGYYFMIEPFID